MRYIILILLNTPIILLALVNIVTQYKLKKVSRDRFNQQVFLWIIILIVLIGSFPLYNALTGRPALDSTDLSLFDIVEITCIVLLFYAVNNQRQKADQLEGRLRDLHRELSILPTKKRLASSKNDRV